MHKDQNLIERSTYILIYIICICTGTKMISNGLKGILALSIILSAIVVVRCCSLTAAHVSIPETTRAVGKDA